MLLEDVVYCRGNGNKWKTGNLRLDCNGSISLQKEDPVFTIISEVLNIKQCAPYLQMGAETDQIPGKPEVPSGWNKSLILYLPNMKNPRKSLWVLFKTVDQMKYWLEHIYSISYQGICRF